MLKLDGVTRAYISKEKQRVDALRGVSFELGNTGMVFVLGKSGSGKSTLLNLLGGLDAPTEGEIVVDGVSMKDFKQRDYDSYRNSYVGFIFQEYNLLDNLNVKENIALALQLAKGKDIDEKVVSALEQVELSADYLTRRVGELSGGEKQRIAIARSIVKDSKLILADEPTGNLDSATGENIWNILKSLSKTKLVVVVSHDRESAEKYADRTIEIADGEIVSDSSTKQVVEEPNAQFAASKKRLSFAVCMRMALNSLFKRKARSISIVVLSILSTFAIVIVQMLMFFSPLDTKIEFVEKHNIPYVRVDSFDHQSFDYIAQNSTYIASGMVENKQQILDFGLTFVGDAQELDENSLYIRLDTLREMFSVKDERNYAIIDGQKVPIHEYKDSPELLVGHQMHIGHLPASFENGAEFLEEDFVVLAGIIDTDVISDFVTLGRDSNYLPPVFATKEFKCWQAFVWVNSDSEQNLILSLGGTNILDRSIDIDSHTILDRLVTDKGLVRYPQNEGFSLADDEIIVTYDVYAMMFNDDKSDAYYVNRDFTELLHMPEHIGERIEFKFLDRDGNVLLDLGSYKLVGVSMNTRPDAKILRINVTRNVIRKIYVDIICQRGGVLIKTDSVRLLGSFFKTLENEYNTPITNAGSILWEGHPNTLDHAIKVFDSSVQQTVIIFSAFGAVLIVVLVLLVLNLISLSIASRKREIGILMALGTTQRDVTNIFVFETLILSLTSLVLMLVLLFALMVPVNRLLFTGLTTYIPFLTISWLTVVIVFAATLALPILAACLPLTRVSRLKPVDAIREN